MTKNKYSIIFAISLFIGVAIVVFFANRVPLRHVVGIKQEIFFDNIETINLQEITDYVKTCGTANIFNNRGNSLFNFAVIYGRKDIANFLLEQGVPLNRENYGWLFSEDLAFFQKVFARKTNLNISIGRDKLSPLMCFLNITSERNQKDIDEIISLFLANGADVNARDGEEIPVLSYVAINKTLAPRTYDILIHAVRDADAVGRATQSPLMYGCIKGNETFVRQLLKSNRKVDVNRKMFTGDTALHLLAKLGVGGRKSSFDSYKNIIKLLLENGADGEICDNKGHDFRYYLNDIPEFQSFCKDKRKSDL